MTELKTQIVETQDSSPPKNCVAIVSTTDDGSALLADPVTDPMKNADKAIVTEQWVLLERLLCKYASAFADGPTDLGRRNLIYHRIEISDSGPVRHPMRRAARTYPSA